ncbi:hypothetical protein D1AOALGA4SA_11843 [Olavius algarvensis Delta 1 endosymbiont]|nr:hypothetical protein D1AOALGA4SA_11843 [Olavius algarvensis Delta 1 endosymbiont]
MGQRAVSGGQRAEGGGHGVWGRGQKTDDRVQGTEAESSFQKAPKYYARKEAGTGFGSPEIQVMDADTSYETSSL